MSGEAKHPAGATDPRVGVCRPAFVPRFGVIHLRNALSDAGQRALWQLAKPRIKDPSRSAAGFSCYLVSSSKMHKPKRVKPFDEFGVLLFQLAAEAVVAAGSGSAAGVVAADLAREPSYQHLADIAAGRHAVDLDEVRGNYYRADATLQNHIDSDDILFTMSLALGEDCVFRMGEATGRNSCGANARTGKPHTIVMKSGDALFFDGGCVPHEVVRVVEGTAPEWWDGEKVENGARLVVLFRERQQDRRGKAIRAANRQKREQQQRRPEQQKAVRRADLAANGDARK
jgi:hypothetical protein